MKQIIFIFTLLISICVSKAENYVPFYNAEFKGNWSKYVQTHLNYPEEASKEYLQGSVMVKFTIDVYGKPTNVEIIRSPYECFSKEVIKLFKYCPYWEPAHYKGHKREQTFITRIYFRIK